MLCALWSWFLVLPNSALKHIMRAGAVFTTFSAVITEGRADGEMVIGDRPEEKKKGLGEYPAYGRSVPDQGAFEL